LLNVFNPANVLFDANIETPLTASSTYFFVVKWVDELGVSVDVGRAVLKLLVDVNAL